MDDSVAFSTFTMVCNHCYSDCKTYLPLKKKSLVPIKQLLPNSPTLITNLLSASMELPILDISCK